MRYAPLRRIITSHASSGNGAHVALHDTSVPLNPALDGQAGLAPLFATLDLPVHTPATLSDQDVKEAEALVPSVVTPGGVNAQVTELAPGFRVGMHRTNSLDYNVFVAGSAWLITPKGDGDGEKEERTLVKAGEVVVQRGTLHAWEATEEGARWVTVVVAALPVTIAGRELEEVMFW
ncbi:hypothetical protein CC85DRAFT_284490 [Cutaneotrichosporon oleaginosum]|uniref:Cupin type-1 domain-containing protein n=1 Tax=Cutaneotrichosporon oleaginosum TaxID=879819 RepID=A0A0J0XR56_9TREE|nr:uncharacterized protein CC85DRAFT_284490 [Cutaneotrichosporon oleaginosum]KLT43565.1 hypothetical protein CC85DRAFT_284490 [Cutaneotrichosporon oleaginosum]TXT05536.1 hypothetical protein COLE_06856 [Cutaneotrichosporon oleaginosum]